MTAQLPDKVKKQAICADPGGGLTRNGYCTLQALYAGDANCHKGGAFLATRGMNRASSGATGRDDLSGSFLPASAFLDRRQA
jgi:hypothetical protein